MARLSLGICCAVVAVACESGAPCSRALRSSVDTATSYVEFGDSTFADATIKGVTAACVESTATAQPEDKLRQRLFMVPATASILTHVKNAAAFEAERKRLDATIVFEAISENGTVLDVAKSKAGLLDATVTRASASIGPFTAAQLAKVRGVRVHWDYGT